MELCHVHTEDNVADVNSKNIKTEVHEKHADKLYEGLVLVELHGLSPEHSRRISKKEDPQDPQGRVGLNNTATIGETVNGLGVSECPGPDGTVETVQAITPWDSWDMCDMLTSEPLVNG